MIPVPRIPQVEPNQKLGFGLVNHIIKRTEYAAELLRQYKCVAGDDMFVEPHPDGTRISYLQGVGGGVRENLLPYPYPSDVVPPTNPATLNCSESSSWSKSDHFGYDVCPYVGPPCPETGPNPSCIGLSVSGYIVSNAIWPNSCLSDKNAFCSYSATFDDGGTIGNDSCPYPGGCSLCSKSGTTRAKIGSFDSKTFFLYVSYFAENGPQGGPYGFIGSGAFFLL